MVKVTKECFESNDGVKFQSGCIKTALSITPHPCVCLHVFPKSDDPVPSSMYKRNVSTKNQAMYPVPTSSPFPCSCPAMADLLNSLPFSWT